MSVRPDAEVLLAERDFDSIFSYTAGAVRSRFLTELRDNQKIVGTRCHKCNMVWVPARSTCIRCFAPLSDFEQVSNIGEVRSFCVVNRSQPFYPADPPFVYGIIRLNGADTGLVHIIDGTHPDQLRIGMKVEAVFRKERTGSILDIECFKPKKREV